jgi:hypothetical protein
MAANQISNQRNKSGSAHKATQPGRRPSPTTDESQRDYGSMGAIAEQASDYVARGASQVREMTRNREGAAVAVALAAGLGLGLVIGTALVRSRREQRSWRDRVTAEGFGRRLMDRIEGLIPDALAEHFAK